MVDAVVEFVVGDRGEGDFFGDAGGENAARFLAQGGLVPTRVCAVVGTDVESVVHGDGPDPGGSAVGDAVVAEGGDVEVVFFGDLAEFVLGPGGHLCFSLQRVGSGESGK